MHSKREKETLQQPSNTFSIMELDVRPQTASTNEASGLEYLRETTLKPLGEEPELQSSNGANA